MSDTSSSSEQSATSFCSLCSLDPCFNVRFRAQYIERARQYKIRIGSTNKKIQFYLYRVITKDRFGTLGRGVRVRLPRCMENSIKMSFPNKDETPFVGFQDSNQESSE